MALGKILSQYYDYKPKTLANTKMGNSWNFATCVPSEVLGPSGIISVNNPLLRSLSLITDFSCSGEKEECKVDLSSLDHLQNLCWRAPSAYHVKTLFDAIERNSERLQKLELDFVDWPTLRQSLGLLGGNRDDGPQSAFASFPVVFGLTRQPPQLIFQAIRELSFTQVPLVAEMAHAINLDTLRSLTMRRCPAWDLFLAHVTERVTESGLPIQLKTLEIYATDDVTCGWGYSTIGNFLDAFDGLEQLFVAHPGPRKPRRFWNHVTRHQATLTKFVHHQRSRDFDDGSPHITKGHDLSNIGMNTRDWRLMEEDPSQNPLATLNLDFLGLCCAPERLVGNGELLGRSVNADHNSK